MTETLTLFALEDPAPRQDCHRCGKEPATVRVLTRRNMIHIGRMMTDWDLARGDDQVHETTRSAPVGNACARYLDACWQIRQHEDCGHVRELNVIWFEPISAVGQ